jgi:hypothetical protein
MTHHSIIPVHALQPQTPTEVLKRHYGDCKDKAALLLAMLRNSAFQPISRCSTSVRTDLSKVVDMSPLDLLLAAG